MAANDAIPATNAKGATDQNTVGIERKSKRAHREKSVENDVLNKSFRVRKL